MSSERDELVDFLKHRAVRNNDGILMGITELLDVSEIRCLADELIKAGYVKKELLYGEPKTKINELGAE